MFRLQVLGEVSLRDGRGRSVEAVLHQPKRLALLAYVATHVGRLRHSREATLALLWPETDERHGRNALRQSLHFLRSHLGDDLLLDTGDASLEVNPHALRSDARAFEVNVSAGRYGRALDHYRGPFMQGFPTPAEPGVGHWIDEQRAWLSEIATRCAWCAARQAQQSGDLHAAADWWRRASELSPYDEMIAQRLISSLVAAGNRGGAVTALRTFAKRLERDLELRPSPATLEAVHRAPETVNRDPRDGELRWRSPLRPPLRTADSPVDALSFG